MKLKKLMLTGFVAVSVILGSTYGCTSNADTEVLKSSKHLSRASSEEDGYDEAAEYQKLLLALDSLYASFVYEETIPQPRLNFWNTLKSVVKADVNGNEASSSDKFLRIISVSIGASKIKYKALKKKEEEEQGTVPTEPSAEKLAILKQKADSFETEYYMNPENTGALHNASIILLLYGDHILPQPIEGETLAKRILNSLNNLHIITSDVNPEDIQSDIDNFKIYFDASNEVVHQQLVARFPRRTQELEVFKNYMKHVEASNSLEELKVRTRRFSEVVERSKISEEAIVRLRSCMSVAVGSGELWQFIDELEAE